MATTNTTVTLEQRYNNMSEIVAGDGNVKTVGNSSFASTHFVSEHDKDFQTNLGPSGVANDDASNVLYHWANSGGTDAGFSGASTLPVTKYAESGRL